jgi:predicted Rossmann fold nucleotide-binding protein DprA/Smf involved in DNA uptake
MIVAVVGSRSITNIDIERFIPKGITMLITGGAAGIDTIAEQYADRKKIKKQIILPDYERYGKKAPLMRDREIVNNADIVIAIWDGTSGGTHYTVKYAQSIGKPFELHIVY